MSGVRCKVPFSLQKLLQVLTIVLVFSPIMPGYHWNDSNNVATKTNISQHNLAPLPIFDDILIREIDATVGQTLVLPCTVKNLGDKMVSWIRSKDLHILTSGRHTFSGDSRFESVHSSNSGDFWGLRIRGVHVSDTGQYECQVNTDPKMSLAIYLTVSVSGVRNLGTSNSKWVSEALIKGPREVYVQNGSPVTFTCEISPLSVASLQSDAHGLFRTTKPRVWWLHDGKELSSFEDIRRGTNITSDYLSDNLRILSTVYIPSTNWKDTGEYTCMQPSTKYDKVKLFIIEGEHSEAMQRDFPVISTGHQLIIGSHIYCILIYLYFLI